MKKSENERNYRNTGLSKVECQRRVDEAIKSFKRDHPGRPVPSSLKNWVANMATDEDIKEAKRRQKERADAKVEARH